MHAPPPFLSASTYPIPPTHPPPRIAFPFDLLADPGRGSSFTPTSNVERTPSNVEGPTYAAVAAAPAHVVPTSSTRATPRGAAYYVAVGDRWWVVGRFNVDGGRWWVLDGR